MTRSIIDDCGYSADDFSFDREKIESLLIHHATIPQKTIDVVDFYQNVPRRFISYEMSDKDYFSFTELWGYRLDIITQHCNVARDYMNYYQWMISKMSDKELFEHYLLKAWGEWDVDQLMESGIITFNSNAFQM